MYKIKSFATILIFTALVPIFTLNATDIFVDLTELCEAEKCEPRTWYAIDSFDPEYKLITNPDEKWKAINKFPIWMNQIFKKDGKLATYSLMTYFDIPEELLNHPEQAGIRFGEIGEVFEIYFNGNLIAKEGEIKNGKVYFHRTVRGKVWQVSKSFMQPKNNQLLVKLSGHPKFDHTGFYLTKHYDFGLADTLKYAEQDRIALALLSIYFTVGLYHLFLFYRRRIELYNLYYGTFATIVAIYLYTRSSAIFEHNWDTAIIQRLELAVLYPGFVLLIKSLEVLFFNKVGIWAKRYGYFSYSIGMITIFCPEMYQAEYILHVWQLSVLFWAIPLIGRIFYIAIRKKITNARKLMTGLLIFLLAAIYDIIDSLILNSGLSFSKYAFFMYIIGFAGILANRFISIHNEIEELNENLEKKVEDRTKELTNSFSEIKLLKDQQDGDYYLTSLLLHPLGANQAKGEGVKIEFLLKQKKHFKFKQWESEIGGDLCRAKTIKLKNRSMTVFLNADAMGKSMQGAGGALVAGAVFNSIIERTLLSPVVQNQHPERWLKNSFVEMHKVFESFDGSMLISVIMGILDNDSGLMYFINAEHPYTVLFRDGQTSFIGHEKLYRKLGSSVVDDFISIQLFQMRDGDVIIHGSDGRDDLLIIDPVTNEKNLNYDEKVFLTVVKKGEGKLNKIYDTIVSMGEITDDLSLLRIEFIQQNHSFQASEENEASDIDVPIMDVSDTSKEKIDLKLKEFYKSPIKDLQSLKNISIAYINLKKYGTAISLILEYLELNPSDSNMLYFLSFAYRKDRNYRDSIDQGERLRLREPFHIKNLINLLKSYASSGNLSRAKEILDSASKFQPDNNKILRLKSQIDKVIELKK